MFFDRLIKSFSSLRLTVACLTLGLVLVFWGTLAQVDLGLYQAQNEFFRSFFVFWRPKGASWKIPIFPGGYLVAGVLLINLITAHCRRLAFTRKKLGIWMVHFGLILLLLGQLLTDLLSRETVLRLREGQAKNYSESGRLDELAVIDATDKDADSGSGRLKRAAKSTLRQGVLDGGVYSASITQVFQIPVGHAPKNAKHWPKAGECLSRR